MNKLKPAILLLILTWAVFLVEFTFELNFATFGIIPRNIIGLRGIVLAPFIHGNIYHLSSNSIPFFVLTLLLFIFYSERAYKVLIWSILLSGMVVWIFGRPAIHIGMSGVIYALAAFLVFAGFYKRKFVRILISLGVILAYGGLVRGLFPEKINISYEAHIAGAVVGIILARIFYREKP